MTDVVDQLANVRLFANLKEDDLRAVGKLFKRTQHPAGVEICRQGRLGHTAYLVESGELRVMHVDPDGMLKEVDRLQPGDFFGETSLLLGDRRDATVEVAQDATLLSLTKDDFEAFLRQHPKLLQKLDMSPRVAERRQAKRFNWQDPDEFTILRLHKDRIVLLRHIAFPTFVLLVDVLGCGYWWYTGGGVLAIAIGTLLALIPVAFIIYLWTDHINDNYVVTNKRVVHEERVFFKMTRTEAPLRAIQNIQEDQEGLLAYLFNFSDLIIETAGERGQVTFREIPDPAAARDIIFEQVQRVKAGARAEELAAIRDAMRHHFGMAPIEKERPAPPPSQKRRLKLTLPDWVTAPFRLFSYFLPPLQRESGGTITWRKHWIALIPSIALPTGLILAATAIAVGIIYVQPSRWVPTLIGYGTAIVFLFPWWLWQFDDWQNDIYQVTDTRIVDVERLPFYLREDRREASLGVIQNIQLEVPGFLGNLLNYGTITIETAGIDPFTFDLVKDPRSVQREIFRRIEAFQAQEARAEAKRHHAEMLDWFSAYHHLQNASTPPPQTTPTTEEES